METLKIYCIWCGEEFVIDKGNLFEMVKEKLLQHVLEHSFTLSKDKTLAETLKKAKVEMKR